MSAIEDSDQIQIGLYDKVGEFWYSLYIEWLRIARFYKTASMIEQSKKKVKIDIPKGFFVILLRTHKGYIRQ